MSVLYHECVELSSPIWEFFQSFLFLSGAVFPFIIEAQGHTRCPLPVDRQLPLKLFIGLGVFLGLEDVGQSQSNSIL